MNLAEKKPAKFGFTRVQKRKANASEKAGQLNLFSPVSATDTGHARVVSMPTRAESGSAFERALEYDERNDERARELYLAAIEHSDCVADAYCNLGVLEFRNGKTDEAFDCFSRSLTFEPRHVESHYNLANLYFDIGDLRLAREHYEIALKIQPAFSNAWFNLGLLHAMNEDLHEAVSALSQFQELVPDSQTSEADDLLLNLRKTIKLRNQPV